MAVVLVEGKCRNALISTLAEEGEPGSVLLPAVVGRDELRRLELPTELVPAPVRSKGDSVGVWE
jgi:hypothetical protein